MSITAKIVGVGVSKLKRSLKSLIKFGLDLQHQQLQQKEFYRFFPERFRQCLVEPAAAGTRTGAFCARGSTRTIFARQVGLANSPSACSTWPSRKTTDEKQTSLVSFNTTD